MDLGSDASFTKQQQQQQQRESASSKRKADDAEAKVLSNKLAVPMMPERPSLVEPVPSHLLGDVVMAWDLLHLFQNEHKLQVGYCCLDPRSTQILTTNLVFKVRRTLRMVHTIL